MRIRKKIQEYARQINAVGGGLNKKIDVLMCAVLYGASPSNYKKFGFDQLAAKQRATYVTHRVSQKMIKTFNNQKYVDIFEDKRQFASHYAKYFKRKWLDSASMSHAEFMSFYQYAEAHEGRFICKPIFEAQGHGICVHHCGTPVSGGRGAV